MKKIFTLITMGAFVLVGKKAGAQINQNFDGGLATLTANCWQFTSMMYATSPSSYVINGNGSLYSEPPVSSDSIRLMRTPLLIVDNSIDISFVYRLSNNLTGQAFRKIAIDLTDNNGVVIQSLANFNLPNNATSSTTYSQTFAVTTPGNYRLAISLSGGQGAGNVRVSLDDLYESEPEYGCLLGSPLAVQLTNFHGNKNQDKVLLQWTVASNESVNYFEIERSLNGRDFITAGLVMTNERAGQQVYSFKESVNNDVIYYRLKMTDKNQVNNYSKTLVFRSGTNINSGIKIISNPATDKLSLSINSSNNQILTIKVYDISGRMMLNEKFNAFQGTNALSLPITNFNKGMYTVEVADGSSAQSAKFIKQ